jgi:pyruvate carboxylase
VVQHFVKQAAAGGIDLFRVFDSLNWVENMRVAIDAVRERGRAVRGAICYSGDLLDARRDKYGLKYYVAMAKALEKAGANIIGIKDMAGICKPEAARRLVKALKGESACRCISTRTTPAASRRPRCWRRSRPAAMPWTARWTR